MKLCDYGCNTKSCYQLKNNKWCCSKSQNSCINIRKKNKESHEGQISCWKGKKHSKEHRIKNSNSNK